jgi:hypothetical protein
LAVILGGAGMQVIAQSVGTGLGLLVRRPAVAFLGTIVLPLGLWLALSALPALHPVRAWVTPFGNAEHLLSGEMSGTAWWQCLTVVLIWTVGLNAAGVVRLRRAARSAA